MKKLVGFYSRFANQHFILNDNGNIIGTKESKPVLLEKLKDRYQMSLVEYPEEDSFIEFLDHLYDEVEIPIITHMNCSPMEVGDLAKKLETDVSEINKLVDRIAGRGLLFDISVYSDTGKRYVLLPEFIVGWYEISVVHNATHEGTDKCLVPEGVDFYELMKMYEIYGEMYMKDSYVNMTNFCHRVTPFGFSDDEEVHYCDYETAKGVIENSERVGVMGCVCKMHHRTLGNPIDKKGVTERCCMIFEEMIDMMVALEIGEELTKEDALKLLEKLADSDHMHQPENNQKPRYLCNCHKKWCNVTLGIRDYLKDHITVTSNFRPVFNSDECKECGVCVRRCPLDIIEIGKGEGAKLINEKLCLGCLSCKYGCKAKAISAERTDDKKVPVDFIEQMVFVAFERNKLHSLLFDEPQNITHKLLRRVFSFIEGNPLSEKMKSMESVSSKFLEVFTKKAREEFNKKLK